ncbi:hypothetical protein R6Z02_15710 [Carnobacterium maltaromaticum]|uniref:DNA-binding protein n=1 Tax=Carnobacterium maltaromaticum TaxID=2751 RepID=A0AAW9JUZ5_CARML|nr:hypothetical protein [Carnobacterium maltaromaticum]MDW5525199.1 hypothetical protein [Carnobacterium maltaromaticum]MDZ5760685.1 hypothetical protein [Carnobacterium maltaromaticum]
MNITNDKDMKEWLNNNLLSRNEAMLITKQSASAFDQSVASGKIIPYLERKVNGRKVISLYKKEDLQLYAKNKKRV